MKKVLLLAVSAVAMVAFAIPAVASAENYRLFDVPAEATISEHTEVGLSGNAKFETLGTGIECTVHATLTTKDGVSVKVSAFTITTSTCKGFGFLYNNCKLTADTVDNLPWTADVKQSALTITNVLITGTLSNCEGGVTFTNLEYPKIDAVVDNVNGITKATVGGTGTGTNNFGTFQNTASGSLSVVGEDSGTYGIETY